jgi:hypothetical protein
VRLEGLNWLAVGSTVGVCEVSTNLFLCPVSALLFISILVKPLFLGDVRITLKLMLGSRLLVFSKEIGLEVNADKTEYMVMS